MKIMVCGSMKGNGITKILKMRKFLEEKGFKTIKQFSKGKDYSNIRDFREKTTLAKNIIKHDLACIKKADVLVVLPEPSFGTSIEMFVAKNAKKKLFSFLANQFPVHGQLDFQTLS